MKTEHILQMPADTVLAEELASEDVVEMANLTMAQTGVPGTIFHFDGNGRAWAAGEILSPSRALATELFGFDLRRSNARGQ